MNPSEQQQYVAFHNLLTSIGLICNPKMEYIAMNAICTILDYSLLPKTNLLELQVRADKLLQESANK